MKTEEIKLLECKPYSCRMTKEACAQMKEKAHMKPTKTVFIHFNQLSLCRGCGGVT